MKKKSLSALVTGAAGFIGSNLVRRLLTDGFEVFGLDNFSTGRKENLASLLADPHFHFEEFDLRQPLSLSAKVDWVFNLACPASPPRYQADPLFTLETAFLGLRNALLWADKQGAKLIQASTSEVYGDPAVHPQSEDYWGHVNPIGPRSCYDEGKRVGETLCREFFKKRTNVVLVRIFNSYGPFMDPDDGRVVTNFLTQALANEPLTIYGQGEQTRSFCYIDDLVEGLIRAAAFPRRWLGPVNLGNPREETILSFAEIVLKLIPESRSRLVFTPLPGDDPCRRCPDISLAKEKLGWEPRVSLEEGLQKTIAYLKNEKNN